MSKELILESFKRIKKMTNKDPSRPGGEYRELLVDDASFDIMTEALSEHMTEKDKNNFKILAENTKMNILMESNTSAGLNPYESMVLPILSVFYPRLIAKEAVTVVPMNKPDIFRPFIRAKFQKHTTTPGSMVEYSAPAVGSDIDDRGGISSGPKINVSKSEFLEVPLHPTDSPTSLSDALGITPGVDHIQKDFHIYKVEIFNGTDTAEVEVDIDPTTNGYISERVGYDDAGVSGLVGKYGLLEGRIDYDRLEINLSQVGASDGANTWNIRKAYYTVTASLEENTLNSKVTFDIEKVRFVAKNRQISAEWSVLMEQDARALYDINVQSELISIIASQIATDIDREIISQFISAAQNSKLVPSTHVDTFNKQAPSGYSHGPKLWYENIYPKMSKLSAQIYQDTNIGSGNIILANPMDASVLESTSVFSYVGQSTTGGDIGFQKGTINQGKWTVFVSTNVPEGYMPLIYKPSEEMKSTYIYAPYVPVMLTPYPLGLKPSMTVLTRYANRFIRTKGISLLKITDVTP
jgi:hypothetical protein